MIDAREAEWSKYNTNTGDGGAEGEGREPQGVEEHGDESYC